MNRLLISLITPGYGQTISTIRFQLFSSNLSRQYSSIIRSPSIVNNYNELIFYFI